MTVLATCLPLGPRNPMLANYEQEPFLSMRTDLFDTNFYGLTRVRVIYWRRGLGEQQLNIGHDTGSGVPE
jgi:hypothetical protein